MEHAIKPAFLAALISTGAALATPGAAAAATACARWDIDQPWIAVQSNGYGAEFVLRQNKTALRGEAYIHFKAKGPSFWDTLNPANWKFVRFSAASVPKVTGRINGNAIEMRTDEGGVYTGRIDATGRIDGVTYDQNDSTSSAKWHSNRRLNCMARPIAALPAPVLKPPVAPPLPVPAATPGVFTGSKGSASSSVFRTGVVPVPPPVATPSVYCKSGFVWREARATDLVCVTPDSRARVAEQNRTTAARIQPGGGAYGPNTCLPGFVWREAFPGDAVCVTPSVRTDVRGENSLAASRVQG